MADPTIIFPPNYSVTGIRSEDEDNTLVIITGSCPTQSPQDTLGILYRGPMAPKNSCNWNPIDSTGCICLLPKIHGATSSIFYGPDTAFFTPSLGEGNIRVVGSYRRETVHNHGVVYEGPLDIKGQEDPGQWTTIVMDHGVAGGPVANTILHSTMGDLIVGNYDMMQGSVATGEFNAFIYNMLTQKFFDLKSLLQLESTKLLTAYGIWKNDTDDKQDGTYYTIAGGLKDHSIGLNVGFMVDFD